MAGNMQDGFDENGNPIRCSFCGKEQGQVRRLVKGPTNTFICDECVAACSDSRGVAGFGLYGRCP